MKYLIAVIVLTICFVYKMEAQFEVCHSNKTTTLHDVYFINEHIGIVVGDFGTIIKSIDGGLNWDLKRSIDTVSINPFIESIKKTRLFAVLKMKQNELS